MDIYEQITKMADEIAPELVAQRRDFHKFAEKGWFEMRTSSIIARKLTEMGYEVSVGDQVCKKDARMGVPSDEELEEQYERAVAQGADPEFVKYTKGGMTGVIGILRCGEGPTVAMRFDIDALGVFEEKDKSHRPACEGFGSVNEGFMHACGHDTHTAMLLGAGKVLWAHKDEIAGTVRLMFQTSEEQSRGAEVMIENGGVEGADAVFGTHIGTIIDKAIPTGTVVVTPGCCMAAFDKFVIKVNGRGCHGSTPEKGIDPVNIAAHIVIALQAITTRELNATKPLVLTIGKIQGGSQYNVIPNEVVIEGTIRTLEEEVRQFAAKRIGEIAQATAAVFGGNVDYEMIWGAPPVINDDKMAALAAKAAKTVAGEDHVITEVKAPNMGGEDFAYYLEKLPGAFMFLSSSNPAKGTDVSHHNPKFDVDEDVLWEGSAVFVAIVEEFLNK